MLKLLVATAPRILLTAELLIAAMGPVSWLAMTIMAVTAPPGGRSLQNVPQAAAQLLACSSPLAPFHAWSLVRYWW